MPPREALVDDLQESARTVSLHLLGAGWVEASDATLATQNSVPSKDPFVNVNSSHE